MSVADPGPAIEFHLLLAALRTDRTGGVSAEVRQVERGVVISRRETGIDAWLTALAQDLTALAASNARAREALSRLLA